MSNDQHTPPPGILRGGGYIRCRGDYPSYLPGGPLGMQADGFTGITRYPTRGNTFYRKPCGGVSNIRFSYNVTYGSQCNIYTSYPTCVCPVQIWPFFRVFINPKISGKQALNFRCVKFRRKMFDMGGVLSLGFVHVLMVMRRACFFRGHPLYGAKLKF